MSSMALDEKPENNVDWSGPGDLKNPRNWKSGKKTTHVLLISGFTLCSNLAAVMFAPGAPALVADFHIANTMVATFTVSIFILGFAFGPIFIAPLSEIYGRLWLYHVCNVVYLAFTVGCGLSTNTTMFLVFRFICGCSASGPMTIGGGTIADLYEAEERGKAMALFGIGPLFGPVFGPVIGGFVTQHLSWRWTFWLNVVLAGIFTILAAVLMRETFEPILLEHKAAVLRKETGNSQLHARTHDRSRTPAQLLVRAITRPMRMLITSPIVLLLSVYCAFLFGLTYLLFTTFPGVFGETYHFSTELAGLSYLGLGVGMIFSIGLFAVLSDKLLHQPRGGTVARPELRLILMIFATPLVPIGFFWYGWSAQAKVHWIVPILGTMIISLGAFLILMPAQLYLVDAFGAEGAASALAVNIILRSLFGALIPLAGPPLYNTLDLGWGNSVLAFIGAAFIPVPFLFYKYGEMLRTRYPVKY
ncbi:major facilitator superfamily domain-containing protein [Clohesyomyces aquaticus]|uniref:Major facilitator superfamily domain-containing protein n=1 Tax=Clohesyomyces aquaticus TaxID=1231657 RepID=A0A1Y1ZMQ8_9PLEO|nr:major facilitator superfamily domain-containing protein [Clohesyomyces aquaticus]